MMPIQEAIMLKYAEELKTMTLKQYAEFEFRSTLIFWKDENMLDVGKLYMIGFLHSLLVKSHIKGDKELKYLCQGIPAQRIIHALKNLAKYAVLKYLKHGFESLYRGDHATHS